MVRGTYISRYHGNEITAECFWQAITLRVMTADWNISPVFMWKKKMITKNCKAPLVLELQPQVCHIPGQASGLPHTKRLETKDTIFALTVALIQLTRTSQERAYKLIHSASFFQLFTQAMHVDFSVWRLAGFTISGHRTVYICIF